MILATYLINTTIGVYHGGGGVFLRLNSIYHCRAPPIILDSKKFKIIGDLLCHFM